MSEEERFSTVIQEIKEIFLLLTQGDPTPDDEIEARVNLIEKIQTLKSLNTNQAEMNIELFEDVIGKLEKWDTLELWFTESELPEEIKKVINITEELPEVKVEQELDVKSSEEAKKDLDAVQIDIAKIVDQVSGEFKGEIDGLKRQIEVLKHKLDEKEETIKKPSQTSHQRVVKKITPKKKSKLPPPKIIIPIVKKPEEPPHIKVEIKPESEAPKEKIGVKSIENVQVKIEQEIKKLKPSPIIEEKPHLVDEMRDEAKAVLDILDELETTPYTTSPELESIQTKNITAEDKSTSSIAKIEISEETSEYSKKPFISTEASIVEEKSSESLTPVPFIAQKPKIETVSIEEIETESIKSSGNELFDVFSSVGSKPTEKSSPTIELPRFESVKDKKKKEDKSKKKKNEASAFVEFTTSGSPKINKEEPSEPPLEELPTDKDTLYQELIALEGRRYSLEKNFKDIENSYNLGSINDLEYRNRSDDLKIKLEEITARINRIRRIIASI
ncbi:MAG: hypothetical protein ACFFCI_00810 [Promethearchaeota archaeon]